MKLSDWPLTFFDLETTGTARTDRLVTAALVHMTPIEGGGKPLFKERQWLLDPGIPIPKEASDIHGVTTERAREEGADYATGYGEIRRELDKVAATSVLVAFNASFDLGMMHWEGIRLGYPPLEAGYVVDPFVIDRGLDTFRKGSRTLKALCEFHQVAQYDAHSAFGDCMAAGRLAYKMLRAPIVVNKFAAMSDLQRAQKDWHKARQLDFIAYRKRIGDPVDDVDTCWPIRGVQ